MMAERSKHWRPSRARRVECVDATAAHAITKRRFDVLVANPARYWLRFWDRIERDSGPEACWPWRGGKNRNGYGLVKIGTAPARKNFLAHRLAYVFAGGELRSGDDCLHSCDNRACCNPRHLRPGTQAENNRDTRQRGRAVFPHQALTCGHALTPRTNDGAETPTRTSLNESTSKPAASSSAEQEVAS